MNSKENLLFAEELSGVYNLMNMIFATEPTSEFCSTIKELLTEDYFPFSEGSDVISKLHQELRNTLQQKSLENFTSEMMKEYYALFFDPHGLLVSPWHSSYTNPERMLFQEPNFQTKKIYRKYHYQVTNNHFPGDHISIELDFVRRLAEKEYAILEKEPYNSDEIEALLEDHQMFVDKYILGWIDRFIEELSKSKSFYYHKFACMIQEICRLDLQHISIMLNL